MDVSSAAVPGDTPAPRRNIPIQFSATGGEYFRIWIVNLLLTLLTLGIYSAWAKVRRLRYFYGSTSLAGSAFEYHGKPLQILKGRLIAVAALIAYSILTNVFPLTTILLIPLLALAVPWVIVRSRTFQMRMTSWRNIRFGFHGTYGGALAAYVGWALVALVSLYTLVPLWLQRRVRYLLCQTSYGTQRFAFLKGAGPFFALYYASIGLMLLAVVAVTFLLGVAASLLAPGALDLAKLGSLGAADPAVLASMAPVLALAAALGLLAFFAVAAFYQSSFANACFDGLEIGPHRTRSRLRTLPLLWIMVTNVIGMLLTLGLFFPWAVVRQARYQLACMHVDAAGSLEDFSAAAAPTTSATGEEIGELFDVDFGL
jgi:uncharacterized membrane protein YjgN (DUF898 family)